LDRINHPSYILKHYFDMAVYIIYNRRPTTKQGACDATNEHIKNCQEQETNPTNRTVKPKTCIAAARYEPRKALVTEAVAL
jgi:hypothetical protein